MFSRIRKRFTYTNMAMTLALVFAMSGGAYAAGKYLITSTKQISPKVLSSLKGKAGAAGRQGVQGSAGPSGPAGSQGPEGKAGVTGKEGLSGKEGLAGKEGAAGKEGKEGSPWTAGGTLPAGSTETGQWSVQSTDSANEELKITSLSFTIPLASVPNVVVFVGVGTPTPEHCKGSATEPGAESGYLCVFAAETFVHEHQGTLNYAATTNPAGNFNAGRNGAELVFTTKTPTTVGEPVSAEGSWAVTG